MSDFTVIDLQSDKRITADDGEEVTLYIRPGGTKSAIVRRTGDWGDGDKGINQWEVRYEAGSWITAAFTIIQVSGEMEVVGGGPTTATVASAAAIMLDLQIPPFFIGINRCSVLCHVGSTTLKAVTVKFVILPFDKWLTIALPQGLVDIIWELHSDNAWSEGLAERWAPNANDNQSTHVALRAGMDVQFAVVPMIDGAPLTGATDVSTLSFDLRLALRPDGTSPYDSDPLLTVAAVPAAGFIATVGAGADKYYPLTATLGGDAIVAAFADLNALRTVDPTRPVDYANLRVFGQFTLTTGGKKYVTRGIPFYLEQPAALLA